MVFRKKIERSCSYCQYGAKINKEQVLCVKRAVVSAFYACRKFKYDPCKRLPPKAKAINFAKYDNEDFTL